MGAIEIAFGLMLFGLAGIGIAHDSQCGRKTPIPAPVFVWFMGCVFIAVGLCDVLEAFTK